MDNPCNNCPYDLTDRTKINLCNNPENNLCKYWLVYKGYLIGREEGNVLEKE